MFFKKIGSKAKRASTDPKKSAKRTSLLAGLSKDSNDGYTINEKTQEITLYTGKNTEVILPAEIRGIQSNAFQRNQRLRKLTIPRTVTHIGEESFKKCVDLEEIIIDADIKILPESIFEECERLKKVVITSPIEKISSSAFYGCTSLEEIQIPDSVTNIDDFAFAATSNLRHFTFPRNLKRIGLRAFIASGLEEIDLSELSFTPAIRSYAFAMSEYLVKAKVKGLMTDFEAVFWKCKNLLECELLPDTSPSDCMFLECEKLEKVTLHEGIRTIPQLCFPQTSLSEISIPATVTEIKQSAFSGCKKLKNVSIPQDSHLSLIENSVFLNCEKLEEFYFPEGLQTIGEYAFQKTNLKEIFLPESISKIDQYAFSKIPQLQKAVFSKKSSLSELSLDLFWACNRLSEVELPDQLTKIHDSAFSGCLKLRSIRIPPLCKDIHKDAFYHCSSLTHVEYPLELLKVPEEKQEDMHSEEKERDLQPDSTEKQEEKHTESVIRIPDGVEEIMDSAYEYNLDLEEIILPPSIRRIGRRAFYHCKNLRKVTMFRPGNFFPNLKSIGEEAFSGCSSLTELQIPHGVSKIGSHAFAQCIHLRSINLPVSTKEIDTSWYDGCDALETIRLQTKVFFEIVRENNKNKKKKTNESNS